MKIIPIFADEDCLLSAHFENETSDEFERLFDNWVNIEYLFQFFKINKTDLQRPFWKGMTIEQAVLETRNEASELRNLFIEISKKHKNERIRTFKRLFRPLTDTSESNDNIQRKKVYGNRKPSWLRLYALRVGDDMFIITGGAIKLTDNMEERPHTQKELRKIESCKQYLKDKGIIDTDGMTELLEIKDYE